MSSTILYKFRSGTTFEALSLPGTAARLIDIKKAIVAAKKLDQAGGAIEFDLAVKDATTNEEYTDESMLLPRGTRVVVQRLPAAKGHGFLARLARSQFAGGPHGAVTTTSSSVVPANFYTIDGRAQEEDDEFVSTTAEEKELAALRAATETASTTAVAGMPRVSGGGGGGGMRHPAAFQRQAVAGSGPPQQRYQNNSALSTNIRQRPNADPELHEQEKQLMPKKRATGIPRTFLSLSAPQNADGTGDGESNVPLLQPNITGFKQLIQRGGGLSELSAGTKKDLDYALKLTATTIPDYLLCAICHSVVRDAMILPWDTEGRTTCDFCIRDALNKSGFRCPLTGQEGVSPDDLLPNHALRKAAQSFINDVMAKIEEIEELPDDEEGTGDVLGAKEGQILEGETAEKGVLVSRKVVSTKKQNDDPFGGGDSGFGGDVFAVAYDEPKDEAPMEEEETKPDEEPEVQATAEMDQEPTKEASASTTEFKESPKVDSNVSDGKQDMGTDPPVGSPLFLQRSPSESTAAESGGRRDFHKRRGPPVGYQMGPAGTGAIDRSGGPNAFASGSHQSPMAGRGYGGGFQDRPFRDGGRYGGRGRFNGTPQQVCTVSHKSSVC